MERTGAPESYSDQNSIVTESGSPLRNGSTRTEANLLVSSSSKSSAHRRARASAHAVYRVPGGSPGNRNTA